MPNPLDPPVDTSIFEYPPSFPNGQVNDAWVAYFQSINSAFTGGPVLSFNGRGGAVVPISGDYSAGQIAGLAAFIAANGVASFNDRIGPVVPQTGDYEVAQIIGSAYTWGYKASTTTGLVLGLYGGPAWSGTAYTSVADTTVALTASSTNYVQRTAAGVVSANTTGWTIGSLPLYLVTTGSSAITSIVDQRVPATAASVAFLQNGTGAAAQSLDSKAKQSVNVDDFGAIGDGASHPLSGVASFGGINTTGYSLTQWQVIFPHATALSNELDWCAIQAAINSLSGTGGVIALSHLNYVCDQSITRTNGIILQGEGSQNTSISYTGAGTGIAQSTPGTRIYGTGLRGFTLSTSTGAIGVDADSISSSFNEDFICDGFGVGVYEHSAVNGGCVYNEWLFSMAQNCPIGWQIRATGTNSNKYINCRANVCSSIGVDWKDGNQNVWFDGQIENCGIGWQVDATSSALADRNQVAYTRFEGNTTNWVVNSSNVRDTGIGFNHFVTNPTVFTDNGSRTQIIGQQGAPQNFQSTYVSPTGAYRFFAQTNLGSNVLLNFVDAVSSTGTPVVLQIEEHRTSGVSAQGYDGASVRWALNADGSAQFNATATTGKVTAGPITATPSGVVGTPRFSATSTTVGGAISYMLYVNDGSANKRGSFFLDATNNEAGLSVGTSSGNNPSCVYKVGSTHKWGVDQNGFMLTSVGANVASAATITPTGPVFHVTGTVAIGTINLPYTGFTGTITLIPDGIFTTGTGGNIALASTAVVGKAMTMTYDGTKWYPSY